MATFPGAPSPYGNLTQLDVTAATVIKATPGAVVTVAVVVAGSTAGAVYDATGTSGNSTANQVGVIPAAVGNYSMSFPCINGIVVSPGTGQTLAVSYT